MQRAQRAGHVREQETALFYRLLIETVKQLTQQANLLFLRNIGMIDARFALRRTLDSTFLTRPA
ncbi:hypothetical protein D3C78_1850590 [compost metagenome]